LRTRVFALLEDADEDLIAPALTLGEVTALSVSPEPSPRALERALHAGATRAIRIWDGILTETDFLGVARVLGAAIRFLTRGQASYIVIAGDRGRGAVGPAVAERLAMPHLGAIGRVRWRGDRVVAERRASGLNRHYLISVPSVLCLLPPTDRIPFPHDRKKQHVEQMNIAELGLSPHELSFRKRFQAIPTVGPRAHPRVVQSEQALVDRLRAEGLLQRSR
jgi:electron transfer flavoprotein alpha/beta subunit